MQQDRDEGGVGPPPPPPGQPLPGEPAERHPHRQDDPGPVVVVLREPVGADGHQPVDQVLEVELVGDEPERRGGHQEHPPHLPLGCDQHAADEHHQEDLEVHHVPLVGDLLVHGVQHAERHPPEEREQAEVDGPPPPPPLGRLPDAQRRERDGREGGVEGPGDADRQGPLPQELRPQDGEVVVHERRPERAVHHRPDGAQADHPEHVDQLFHRPLPFSVRGRSI